MIVIVQAHDAGYEHLGSISSKTVSAYCRKHDYQYYYEPNIDPTEGDACKIRIFNQLYGSGAFQADDVYCWVDSDALIMNSDKRLEDYASQIGEAHVMYGCDPNGINTGVWFARFTSRADHFLRVSMNASLAMGWSDQPGIFQTMLQPIFEPWVKVVPGKGFNSMPYEHFGWDRWSHKNEINNYEPGDLVLHLPGIEFSMRLALMKDYVRYAT